MPSLPISYILSAWWQWIIDPGIELAILVVVAFLVPRVGRLAIRLITRHLDPNDQESKQRLAIVGTAVYLVQLIAYFFLSIAALKEIGVPLAGAAIPATVISAAVGLGAQSIIADFLAGFFIISEKQFGVGDWVRFQGPGIDVEGDVIQITMRATRVRTLAGETVNIPNSTARVCINHSNYWARAVVVMPIPLLGSDSIDDAVKRSTDATLRALEEPGIAGDVTGELDVHPSVGVEEPNTVGMPWMVNMRFIVQVNPARQWAVERAIRTKIIEEFWKEYGSATTISGAVRDTLDADAPLLERALTRAPLIDVDYNADADGTRPADARKVTDSGEGHTPVQGSGATGTATVGTAGSRELSPEPRDPDRDRGTTDGDRSRSDLSTTDPADGTDTGEPADPGEEVRSAISHPGTDSTGWRRFISFGGRVRPSTSGLCMALVALLFFKGFTLDPSAIEDAEDILTTTPQEVLSPEETTPPSSSATRSPGTPSPTPGDTATSGDPGQGGQSGTPTTSVPASDTTSPGTTGPDRSTGDAGTEPTANP
ncbi:mechanosensitive ion channel [Corynebacterium sp. P7202]|uniref:Mechanosensitive ion channel n=1 Tax=Corynebacterium pygosceleis TaxID=2800406 RepID=A0A9Q4C9H2_9CORY|nr:mechanosensitive ion channel family protein [Corynebacterium pygosceleis]MCK7637867.1 mechanosensitive ion channel [Corynebacterium pygosceleis]MCX7468583.1 mechanosensitive ion channel [Corynebacterium pygosceleis]